MNSLACGLILAIVVASCQANFDYGEALYKSLVFYQAQRSGKLYGMHELASWRQDSALNDRGNNGEDLTGGYYDAGDYVKFGYPLAFTIATLAWGVIDYEDAFTAIYNLPEARNAIKWGTDWMLKAHVSPNEFYGQVGDGDLDHAYWGRPEDMTMERPAFKIDPSRPGTDLAASTAAALAAASIVFRNEDANYANTLLTHATQLYDFADNYRGKYSDSITDAQKFYKSSDDYLDDLVWGAIWIYRATYDAKYINLAKTYYQQFGTQWRRGFGWLDKSLGSTAMLYKVTKESSYRNTWQQHCDYYVYEVPKTPKGLAYINQWGSLRQSAQAVFICLQAADEGIQTNEYRNFAKTQIDYMLGSTGRSYVVGYGTNPPTHEHHRAASCPDKPQPCDYGSVFWGTQPNYHILYGALVGGPDENDNYEDDRSNYVQNEVACDYNAAFQGALAALKKLGY